MRVGVSPQNATINYAEIFLPQNEPFAFSPHTRARAYVRTNTNTIYMYMQFMVAHTARTGSARNHRQQQRQSWQPQRQQHLAARRVADAAPWRHTRINNSGVERAWHGARPTPPAHAIAAAAKHRRHLCSGGRALATVWQDGRGDHVTNTLAPANPLNQTPNCIRARVHIVLSPMQYAVVAEFECRSACRITTPASAATAGGRCLNETSTVHQLP